MRNVSLHCRELSATVVSRIALDVVSTVFGLPLRQLLLAAGFAPLLLPRLDALKEEWGLLSRAETLQRLLDQRFLGEA